MRSRQSKKAEIQKGLYDSVFMTPQGKKVLWDIMKHGYIVTPTFTEGGANPNEMLVREGHRTMVLRILRILDLDMAKYRELMKQQKDMEDTYE